MKTAEGQAFLDCLYKYERTSRSEDRLFLIAFTSTRGRRVVKTAEGQAFLDCLCKRERTLCSEDSRGTGFS